MTIKTLSAIAIFSAALSSPVLARDTSVTGPVDNRSAHQLRHFRGAYNQAPLNGPDFTGVPAPRGPIGESLQYDRSFPGGRDPDLNPSGS